MRVLVTGGRNYDDSRKVCAVLDKLRSEAGIAYIIEGGANGADALARRWAEMSGIPVRTFEADWENQGRFSGPARNQRMLDEGKPDLVIAFAGGRGTADMCRKARKAGVQVVDIAP